MSRRVFLRPSRAITPVARNSRSTGSAGLAPALAHTARVRTHTVENAASTGSPGTARTASIVIHMPLAAHWAVMCLSLLAGPWPGLARTGHPGTERPYRSMAVMSRATTISFGMSPRRRSARSCRDADARSATSASRAWMTRRAHSPVGTLPTT